MVPILYLVDVQRERKVHGSLSCHCLVIVAMKMKGYLGVQYLGGRGRLKVEGGHKDLASSVRMSL